MGSARGGAIVSKGGKTYPLGHGPPLEVVEKVPTPEEVFDLKEVTFWKKVAKVYGPAVIALGMSIGSGEYLLGPSLFMKYGMGLLWLITLSAILQTSYNYMWAKWTITTGEIPIVGMLRAGIWAGILGILLIWLGFGWPGWAATSATAVATAQLGRVATAADAALVKTWAYVLLIVALIIISLGEKVSRTLEIWNWFDLIVILGSFVVFDVLLVPADVWAQAAVGLVSFGYMPEGIDPSVLAGVVGYTGFATGLNYVLANYYRDKGYGVGSLVGYIPAVIGGKKVPLSPVGKIPDTTPENISVMKRWYKLMLEEQVGIFWVGAIIGMILPGLLAWGLAPGQEMTAWGVAAYEAQILSKVWGAFGWGFGLLVGALTLFKTQVGLLDVITRNTTDILWKVEGVRKWAKEDVRRVYYTIVIIYLIWTAIALNLTRPFWLIVISANMANFGAIVGVPLILYLNSKLPKEYKASWPLQLLAIVFMLFCGYFFWYGVISRL